MKKKLLILLLILLSAILIQYTPTITYAEESVGEDSFVVNTLYPEGVLDYQNLENINCIDLSSNYIAYSINTNSLHIINKETKHKITINNFTNIYDIKFITKNQLAVVDLNSQYLSVVSLDNNTYTITTINTISLNNVILADIYHNNNSTLVGLIRQNDEHKNILTLHQISLDNGLLSANLVGEYNNRNNNDLNTATHIIVTQNKCYVTFTNNENNLLVIENGSDSATKKELPNPLPLSSIQSIEYHEINNQQYILISTAENLYVIDGQYPENTLTTLISLNIRDIESSNESLYISKNSDNTIIELNISIEDDNTIIKEEKTLIAGANNAIGRFKNVSNIYTQGNILYIADTTNNRIQIINKDNSVSVINDLPVESYPHSIILDNNQDIYFNVLTSTNSSAIYKYSKNEDNIYSKSKEFTTCNSSPLGLVSSITVTNNNIIYMLSYSNNQLTNQLLTLHPTNGLMVAYTFPFNINENSQIEYIKEHSHKPYEIFKADEDAKYDEVIEIDLDQLEPLAACPSSPDQIRTIRELAGKKVGQVLVGSCTNGGYRDLALVAKALKGRMLPWVLLRAVVRCWKCSAMKVCSAIWSPPVRVFWKSDAVPVSVRDRVRQMKPSRSVLSTATLPAVPVQKVTNHIWSVRKPLLPQR